MQTSCSHCHQRMPILRKLRGKLYCSDEHEDRDLTQQSLIALARVMDPALVISDRPRIAAPASAGVPVEDRPLPAAPLIRSPIPPMDGGRRPKIAEEAFDFLPQPVYSNQSTKVAP